MMVQVVLLFQTMFSIIIMHHRLIVICYNRAEVKYVVEMH